MKSKMSATRIRPPTRYSIDALSVLDHDAFEHVGNVLTAVGRVFEEVERLFPLDHDERIVLFVEQSHDGMLMHAIRLVLEPVDFDRMSDEPLVLLERTEREAHRVGRRRDDPRELPRAEA